MPLIVFRTLGRRPLFRIVFVDVVEPFVGPIKDKLER